MTNRLDPIDAPVAQTDMLVTEVLTLLAASLPVKRSRIHAALLDAGWDGLNRFVSVDVVCQAINPAQADGGVSADQLHQGPDPQSRHQADGGK
jgi:hypothetical protein